MSKNLDKYKKAFIESLEISNENTLDNLKYNDIEEWDSIGHMGLISAIEDVFEITVETNDVIDFSSFKKGKEILKKYKVEF
jgi:acyl carrier protein|tara:strand:- start:161 stop:403 length:243 start_codon:yes stop_codon:yes gene_type:complete